MEGNDRERPYPDLWKAQEDRPMEMTMDQLYARARKHQREQLVVYRGPWAITALFLLGFIYDLTRIRSPWVITGVCLALTAFVGMAWGILSKSPNRTKPSEACVDFLRREFDAKRRGLLRVRNCLLLLYPALLATWWGQRPVTPVPWVLVAVCVAFLWYSFSYQAKTVAREMDKLGAESSSPTTT